MIQRRAWSVFTAGIGLYLCTICAAQEVLVQPDHAQGVYQPSETIRWRVEAKGVAAREAAFVLRKGGLTEVSRGKVDMSAGQGQIEAKLDEPGWLLVEVSMEPSPGKRLTGLGGALIAPEKIQPAAPRPADFDAFWDGELKQLAAVPANPQLELAASDNPHVDYFKITMDMIGGAHVRGQLARPKEGNKLPAMLIVQWAGVYPLEKAWVTHHAAEGWLVLNINAHDLPIDQSPQFYQDQATGPLNNYPAIGNDDRETSYFLRMYLSCYRAAQYLTERSDWDGRTLVVSGGSQGGLQAIVTGALHPRVTAIMASVPAGCDHNGASAQRLPGWPMWCNSTQGKNPEKVRRAAGYFDVVNFASRVKCPTLIGVGLIDRTCPAPGVFAAYDQMQGPKEIIVLPQGEHQEKNGSHAPYYTRFNAWDHDLLRGAPAPVEAN